MKLEKTYQLFGNNFSYADDCVDVSFRADFYSKKNLIESFQNIAPQIIGNFSERLLSEEEKNRIDIASVSANLGNSLNEISERKAFIFNWENNQKYSNDSINQIFVSPYFIFLYCRGDKDAINAFKKKALSLIDIINDLSNSITLCGIRFTSKYEFLGKKEAFPTFGLKFYPLGESIDSAIQSNEAIFTNDENNLIIKILSKLDYVIDEETQDIIGKVNIKSSVYSQTENSDKNELAKLLDVLIKENENFVELCAE